MDATRSKSGGMDIRQQREMWQGFVRLVIAAAGISVLTLILMAIFLL